jgi:hypothetical protein
MPADGRVFLVKDTSTKVVWKTEVKENDALTIRPKRGDLLFKDERVPGVSLKNAYYTVLFAPADPKVFFSTSPAPDPVNAQTPMKLDEPSATSDTETLIESVPFRWGQMSQGAINQQTNAIVVPVSVSGGQSLPFVIDTGCSQTTLRAGSFSFSGPALGARQYVGIGGPQTGYVYEVASLGVGKAIVRNCAVALMDIQSIGDAYGLLGNDFALHFTIKIDYRRKTVDFYESDSSLPADQSTPLHQ